ncbi:gliding motility lipoprotein GldH [Ulvibacterium sp.]|uniref:gliding motility lipoprotein GldH n=1 Tax=Ulvibacterium sp. TaxID=2665914 RepID=UPI00262D80F6|nr:gliding motility lipoprotein GldH [Ulvibacterium sp.]
MFRRLFALTIVPLFVSCNDALIKAEYKATDKGSWNKENTIEFTFSEMDTLHSHNLFINIRNDETFRYSNLFLIAELDFPSGQTIKDTLEYEMARPDGSWLGKGSGSVKENKLWYKENIVFPTSGVYTLRVSHAMRKNGKVEGIMNLQGITDVGFQIEKSDP